MLNIQRKDIIEESDVSNDNSDNEDTSSNDAAAGVHKRTPSSSRANKKPEVSKSD